MKHVTTMSRNCMTRALSITLILGLLLSSLAFSPNLSEIFSTNVWADTDGYWNDYTDTAWYYNTNPDESTYKIGTAEELAGLAKLVNDETDTFAGKTIQLTDNINLDGHDWVPIGVGSIEDENEKTQNVFKGTFDGQGRTISNMHIGTSKTPANYKYAGLFGYVQADAGQNVTIQNVNIGKSSWVFSESLKSFFSAGGICAFANAEDSATLTISNCSNSANISIYYSDHPYKAFAGGICAYAKADGSATITINNCSNSANIVIVASRLLKYVGGICAYAEADGSAATLTISNCSNSGDVTASGNVINNSAGGICAKAKAKASAMITINNCSNSGQVRSSRRAGGICAIAKADSNSSITISNCSVTTSNQGYSDAISGDWCAGGICAYAKVNAATITIINCSNSADIVTEEENYKYAGGICAYAEADGSAAVITISNCINSGEPRLHFGGHKTGADGICAYATATDADASIIISNCYYNADCANSSGIKRGNVKKSSIALSTDQMKAAAGTINRRGWKRITVSDINSNKLSYYTTSKAIALVDALNAWAKAYNNTTPAVEALYWECKPLSYPNNWDDESRLEYGFKDYPTFSAQNTELTIEENTWLAMSDKDVYIYADFSPFTDPTKGNSKDDAYEIENAAQLAALAILVNNPGEFGEDEFSYYDDDSDFDYYSDDGELDYYNKVANVVKDANNNTATCSNFLNKYIKLTADIDLNGHDWVPIGYDKNSPFKGNFDGQGHTISNMHIGTSEDDPARYTYTGLFGYVQAVKDITIENVNIGQGSYIYSTNFVDFTYAGGICAYTKSLSDDATIKISNCSNSAEIYTLSNPRTSRTRAEVYVSSPDNGREEIFVGGICAYAEAYAATLTINNCNNSAEITTSSDHGAITEGIQARIMRPRSEIFEDNLLCLGGICAVALADAGTITISNCCNSAKIYADDDFEIEVGGICAIAEADIKISNCYYKKGAAATGIANEVDQAGEITALPESQMTAAAGTTNGQGWVDITINGESQGKIALVDALGAI